MDSRFKPIAKTGAFSRMSAVTSRVVPDSGHQSAEESAARGDLRYVARQPILDARGNLHGYELLFRGGASSVAFDGDGDSATQSVLDNTLTFGVERLTGGLPMFVNCTREALLDGLVKIMPPQLTVLEILENLEPDAALVTACRELKALGYKIALDDFEWSPLWAPMVELADYIKVDMHSTTGKQRVELISRLRSSQARPMHARLILERVETQADLQQAQQEGFTLFQGFYFCRPEMMQNREVPANRLVHLRILQAILKHPLDVKEVTGLVKLQPSLTYRLLRIANSPIYATRQVVSSIQGALVMIGDEMFRRVAMLAVTAELKGAGPSELLRMAFLRGRFCELAAVPTGRDATEQYLLGLLSLLPAMLDVPMESMARALPLRRQVHQALLGEANAERAILSWLECYELGQWERCDCIARQGKLEDAQLPRRYADALLWAEINVSLAAE
jgi:c-di-GMP-related signal transduction protein